MKVLAAGVYGFFLKDGQQFPPPIVTAIFEQLFLLTLVSKLFLLCCCVCGGGGGGGGGGLHRHLCLLENTLNAFIFE